ncbi:MAG TPA: gamma-glutamyl-gamma-aminobutyrate hydrolase family protein [Candidatus Binatia bacterium]|nr:gamma-glutamyl-gamma-aminobutyrate hydrolase family protein [Candidatus Binatia bacterium]
MRPGSTSRTPLIGITADLSGISANGSNRGQEPTLFLPQRYCRAIQEAGGIPLILPPVASQARLHRILERLDGVLISGGNFDIDPSYYGEKPIRALGLIKNDRTEFELELVKLAWHRNLPLLGICGGVQAINVALGGSLYQDIPTQLPHAIRHEHPKGDKVRHRIIVRSRTLLRRIVQKQTLKVNTTHHQAVKNVGKELVINATAQDGLIEGLESSCHSFVLGVQWHPEILLKDPCQRRIFFSFISASERFRRGI